MDETNKGPKPKPSVMHYARQRRNVEMANLVGLTAAAETLNGALMAMLLDGNEPMPTDDAGWDAVVSRLGQDIPELGGYDGPSGNVWTYLLGSLSPDRRSRRKGRPGIATQPRHIPHVAHYLGSVATGFLYDFTTAAALRDLAAAVWTYSILIDDLDSENTRGLRHRYAEFFGSADGIAEGDTYEGRLDWVASFAAPGETTPSDAAPSDAPQPAGEQSTA